MQLMRAGLPEYFSNHCFQCESLQSVVETLFRKLPRNAKGYPSFSRGLVKLRQERGDGQRKFLEEALYGSRQVDNKAA